MTHHVLQSNVTFTRNDPQELAENFVGANSEELSVSREQTDMMDGGGDGGGGGDGTQRVARLF